MDFKHFTILFFLFCCISFEGWSQNGTKRAKLISSFSFRQLNGGIVVVKARLDDHTDTLNFILDTGSGGISIDSATATRYSLPITESDRKVRGIGGIKPLRFYKNATLHLPGVEVNALDFHINDYELLSEVYGFHVDGIIGYSFLRRYIVAIDYDQNLISVYEPGLFVYPKKGREIPASFTTIPVVEQTVSDERILQSSMFFDIGAGLCVLFSEQFVQDSFFLNTKRKMVYTQVEGIAGKINMRYTTLRKIRLGSFRFRKVPLHIYEDDVNVFNYPSVSGLIGNDLLRRFNQVLNYPDQVIHLTPNSHFREPFDYSYTGMNYYFIGGKVVVTDIHQGSPAEKAGFLPGDILIGADNVFTNDIQQYKSILQNTGVKVKVLVMRNDKLIQLTLKVASILR